MNIVDILAALHQFESAPAPSSHQGSVKWSAVSANAWDATYRGHDLIITLREPEGWYTGAVYHHGILCVSCDSSTVRSAAGACVQLVDNLLES